MRNRLLQLVLPLAAMALSACAVSTPIGSIVAYGGDVSTIEKESDEKWLICDGRLKKAEDFPKLAEAIGIAWGSQSNQFYLPDLRGLFLRGVNGSRNDEFKDPDTSRQWRTNNHGGHEGNRVGSLQLDTLKNHSHGYVAPPTGGDMKGHDPGNISQAPFRHPQTDTFGGSETRPKNAYVYYLIRAK